MAGSARYTAILDACVLFPPAVADTLISLHVARRELGKRLDAIPRCPLLDEATAH
jgi:hypothetical protein